MGSAAPLSAPEAIFLVAAEELKAERECQSTFSSYLFLRHGLHRTIWFDIIKKSLTRKIQVFDLVCENSKLKKKI